jgi:hypothetical protein
LILDDLCDAARDAEDGGPADGESDEDRRRPTFESRNGPNPHVRAG